MENPISAFVQKLLSELDESTRSAVAATVRAHSTTAIGTEHGPLRHSAIRPNTVTAGADLAPLRADGCLLWRVAVQARQQRRRITAQLTSGRGVRANKVKLSALFGYRLVGGLGRGVSGLL